MKLTFENGKYLFECTYEEKHIANGASLRWDRENKKWWTDKIQNAAKLAAYADDELRKTFTSFLEAKAQTIEESKASDSNAIIPVPEGLSYLPYQKAGIAYAMKRNDVLIADEMGLGKTIQAIGIVNITENAKKILIICPASLKLNWKREFEKWSVRKYSIGIANGVFPTTNVVIVNYDILKKWNTELRAIEWDILITDEAHYLKNNKAQRTQQVLGKKSRKIEEVITPIKAKKRVFLTGTPIANRPAEMWGIANSLAPTVFSSWGYYMKRYCNASYNGYGWDIKGASNLDELQEKLRETFMVRRLKMDVLKELPAKRRQIIEIPAGEAASVVKKENEQWEAVQAKLEALRVAVELAKAESEQDYNEAVTKLSEASQAAFTEMSKLRHETALAKVPFVIEHINACFEAGIDKILLFAHHKDVIAKFEEAFAGIYVKVTGEVKIEDRQKAVDEFQNNPKIKLFIGNILAAGVGLTLTASSHVIFAELDWVPGNISQAEDRAHRIGQVNNVLVQHLVLEDSLDVRLAKTLVEKQEIIEQSLNNVKEVNTVLPEKIAHIEKEVPVLPFKKNERIETETISFKQVEEEVINITAEQIAAIHKGLQIVAAYCDGAQQIDGMGFSKFDTNFGKDLAYRALLTPKQAILGKKLVIKYKRQIPAELLAIVKPAA